MLVPQGLVTGLAQPAAAQAAPDAAANTAPGQGTAPTLLALGDSLTQGYGLAPGDGLVPQLEAWLHAHGTPVSVINAGVSGDTTAGGRARLDWSLTPEVNAVMVALGGNDLLRGLPPAAARANLEAILQTLDSRGLPVLLVGLAAPGNYGPAYQAEFNAIWPDLAQRYQTLLLPDLLAPIASLSPEARARDALMQADNIHPAAAGVKRVVEVLGPQVQALMAEAARKTP